MANSVETRRVVSYIFIVVLAALFALQWGPGSKGCDTGQLQELDVAATVNGKPIPLRDFAREYAQQAERFRRQGLPSEMLTQLGIHRQVLDQMVNNELLAQAAEQKGLTASDKDLADLYAKSPLFQKDGKFDHDQFVQYVQEVENTTEVLFEDKLRRQLAAQRMAQLVEASVVVSEDEVKARYLRDGDSAKVAFVRFAPAMYASRVASPKRGELTVWLDANAKAVADFYEANKFTYFIPEKVKARQILLKLPADASPEAKAAVATRAQSLKKDLDEKKGDFAAVAKTNSEDLDTKEKGGDLGLVDRLQLPPAFADVLFALKPGEVSIPVETPLGFFIGTVESKQAAQQRPLEAVREEIAAQLWVKERTKALALAAAEKALAEVRRGKRLAELFPDEPTPKEGGDFAQETKPTRKETTDFASTADAIPQLGTAPEAMRAIFARTSPGLVESLVTVGDAVAIVEVLARKLPSDDAYAKEKLDLTLQVEKGKQYEVREAFLKALRQSGTVITNERSLERVVGS